MSKKPPGPTGFASPVRALTALGARVEMHYGAPQDTEWAIDADGRLWLTQARPITTLFPLPKKRPEAKGTDLRVYFCFSVAQGLYRPITPMGMSGFRVIASAAAKLFGIHVDDPLEGPPVFAEAGQRLFFDLTNVLRGRVGRALMPRLLDVMEARSAAILRHLCKDPRLSLTRRSPMLFIRRVLRIAWQYKVPLQILQGLVSPKSFRERVQRIGAELASRLALAPTATVGERLDFIERVLESEIIQAGVRVMPLAGVGFGNARDNRQAAWQGRPTLICRPY